MTIFNFSFQPNYASEIWTNFLCKVSPPDNFFFVGFHSCCCWYSIRPLKQVTNISYLKTSASLVDFQAEIKQQSVLSVSRHVYTASYLRTASWLYLYYDAVRLFFVLIHFLKESCLAERRRVDCFNRLLKVDISILHISVFTAVKWLRIRTATK